MIVTTTIETESGDEIRVTGDVVTEHEGGRIGVRVHDLAAVCATWGGAVALSDFDRYTAEDALVDRAREQAAAYMGEIAEVSR